VTVGLFALGAAPAITSTGASTFRARVANSFTVTTTGTPTPTLSEIGALPTGVTFTDNGDGTATLAGTPAAGTVGSYPLTIHAVNGTSPDASQNFTLTVRSAPTVRVLAPNGGESWARDQAHTISWSFTNASGTTVRIVLLRGSTRVATISPHRPTGSGAFTWTPGLGLSRGANYRVRIVVNGSSISDNSDAPFTLT
jgi:hypothetical protein